MKHGKQLIGYVDADWSNDTDDRKLNTGYLFKYLGAPITWSSKKQALVTLSLSEAEYVALSEAAKEAIWIRRLLQDFNEHSDGPTVMFKDNQSCIRLVQDAEMESWKPWPRGSSRPANGVLGLEAVVLGLGCQVLGLGPAK